jgi:cytoskeletal protein CcmA (bactofilin family)
MKNVRIKKAISESGYALPAVLIMLLLAGLIVVPSLSLLGTSLNANRVIDEEDLGVYAADAGIQYAMWHLRPDYEGGFELPSEGEEVTLDFPETITGHTIDINISNVTDDGNTTYQITSTATKEGGDTNIISYVAIIPPTEGISPFDYALCSLDGDIVLEGQSETDADEVQGGDIYAMGNIYLNGQAEVNGDAIATGTISADPHAYIAGAEIEGDTNPPSVPEIDTNTYKTETLSIDCESIPDAVSSWSNPAGDYIDPVRVIVDMNISGSGNWVFYDRVCIGRDLNISSFANVTFKGPVKVQGDINISTSGAVAFEDTVYVGDDIAISSTTTVNLGNTVYVCDQINVSGQADLIGAETIVAEGTVVLSGQSQLPTGSMPFIVSLAVDTAITITGQSWTSAIMYAPNGNIGLSGQSMLYGVAVGTGITGSGESTIVYPADMSSRDDLPRASGTDGRMDVLVYTVQ